MYQPITQQQYPLQLPTSLPLPLTSNDNNIYVSENAISSIPPGYRLGGTPIVPSSPITAVAFIPLSSTPTFNKQPTKHPLLIEPSTSDDFFIFNPVDLFESQNLASQQHQHQHLVFENKFVRNSDERSSSTTTPTLTFHSSPKFEQFLLNPPSFNSTPLLPSIAHHQQSQQQQEYPAFIPSQTYTSPSVSSLSNPILLITQQAPSPSPSPLPQQQPQKLSTFVIPTPPPSDSHPEQTHESRKRTRLTAEQREYMVSVFDDNNQPNTKSLKEVAARVGTSLRHVQFW
ncbi:UNVERIFIED_CONTAM: hypothetical protein HDU68_006647 [Siphonaria sp. JEL0065]|nr:hypothetical protein HDU68_006647 [Siphonaria sp. JEL0065]